MTKTDSKCRIKTAGQDYLDSHIYNTRGKVLSWEYIDPRESEICARRQLTIALKLSYYLFIIAKLFKVKDGCLKFVYIGKNPRFYGVFGQ